MHMLLTFVFTFGWY